mmetsp:Transcript_137650/g.343548  ORF Transcript_137650/g.343548 Transcript_137650/m.343548 type:complete len:258 (-) Transcript_137650:915-1688(-)
MTMGSCGIIEMAFRSVCRPRLAMSTPSMVMRPRSHSTRRKSTLVIELFPAPVRPTMPIFSPPATARSKPSKASGRPGRYRRATSSKRTAPRDGQALAAGSAGKLHAGSCGRSPNLNSTSRSNEAPFVRRPMMHPMVTIAKRPQSAAYEKYMAMRPGLSINVSACMNVIIPVTVSKMTCKKWHHDMDIGCAKLPPLTNMVHLSAYKRWRARKKSVHPNVLASTAPRRMSFKFDKIGAIALFAYRLASCLSMAKPLKTG